MILIRSVLYYLTLVVSVAVYGTLIVVVGRFRPVHFTDRVASHWGRLNLDLQRSICHLGYELRGTENLPEAGCIVMCKHQSAWETIALRGLLRPAQSWVLKQELIRIPIFGRGLLLARAIPIDRSAGRRAVVRVVEEGHARLAEGRAVIIFPEGTRTAPGQRKKYGIGGAVLAERSGAPVVPIAHNAGLFWRRRGVKKFPGTVQIVIGPPISSQGKAAAEILREVEDWIESTVETLPGERDLQ